WIWSCSVLCYCFCFFFSSRRRHTRFSRDWSSDVCSSDLAPGARKAYSRELPTSWRGGPMASWASPRISRRGGTGIRTVGQSHRTLVLSERVMMEIRAGVELPARREDIEFRTEDGLRLVGELSLPESAAPVATMVALHPLTTAG